ncbi:hypothetical protein T439DRAFT_77962 [Meredithblackwellia eburnea MCA 4105]
MTAPQPIPSPNPPPAGRSRSHSLSAALPPTNIQSSLSPASLRSGFSALSLASPPTSSTLSANNLDNDEFRQAYHHVRSASFNGSSSSSPPKPSQPLAINTNSDSLWAARVTAANSNNISVSPSSTLSDDKLPTPPSSSPSALLYPLGLPPPSINPAGKPAGRASSLKGKPESVILEDDECAIEVLDQPSSSSFSPPASSSIFANGARWGWPQSPSTTTTSSSGGGPPSPPNGYTIGSGGTGANLQRRASMGSSPPAPPPPSSSSSVLFGAAMTAPLGRVTSAGAGAGAGSPTNKASEGFGIFRRLSVGGFGAGGRPKPPSPPPSVIMHSPPPPPEPKMAPPPPAAEPRGRQASGGKPAKRRISPMGERMLRGGLDH